MARSRTRRCLRAVSGGARGQHTLRGARARGPWSRASDERRGPRGLNFCGRGVRGAGEAQGEWWRHMHKLASVHLIKQYLPLVYQMASCNACIMHTCHCIITKNSIGLFCVASGAPALRAALARGRRRRAHDARRVRMRAARVAKCARARGLALIPKQASVRRHAWRWILDVVARGRRRVLIIGRRGAERLAVRRVEQGPR